MEMKYIYTKQICIFFLILFRFNFLPTKQLQMLPCKILFVWTFFYTAMIIRFWNGIWLFKNIIMKINKVQIFGLHMHYLVLHISIWMSFYYMSTTLCDDKIFKQKCRNNYINWIILMIFISNRMRITYYPKK